MLHFQTLPNGTEYLTKEEAAAIVRLSPRTIERAIKRGDLPAGGTPGRIRIRRDDLDEWISRPRSGNGA